MILDETVKIVFDKDSDNLKIEKCKACLRMKQIKIVTVKIVTDKDCDQ